MAGTAIEWTDKTWNPTTGCDRVSVGCDNCYALTMARRLKGMHVRKYQVDGDARTSGAGFGLTLHREALGAPLHWRQPQRVFVNSMSDLFHPKVPIDFIRDVFAIAEGAPQHVFQVLTKRPLRAARFAERLSWPDNVWLGTSVEIDRYCDRVDHLRAVPAAVRFLSLEPLLGALPSIDLSGIGWVIVGGESGAGSRVMDPVWARQLRDASATAGVAFFFKQWGSWAPADVALANVANDQERTRLEGVIDCRHRRLTCEVTDRVVMVRVGRKKAGRILDGRVWDEMPPEWIPDVGRPAQASPPGGAMP